ncbi:50S ribosomal protein L24 [Candidatus Peregrinibacteria bacterium]|nr:MAG: 50S ribosomal protein L24 [Candidatus Peregrinibacteria bacterium]
MKIKTGDNVVVIAGKDRNKTGKVLRVLEKSNRVVVEGLNMVVRHVKKTATKKGSKSTFEASIAASNVMLIDPKTKKASRVGYRNNKDGKKERIAKKSNTVL